MGPMPKLVMELFRSDRVDAMKIIFVYAPHNLSAYVTFIPTISVRRTFF